MCKDKECRHCVQVLFLILWKVAKNPVVFCTFFGIVVGAAELSALNLGSERQSRCFLSAELWYFNSLVVAHIPLLHLFAVQLTALGRRVARAATGGCQYLRHARPGVLA